MLQIIYISRDASDCPLAWTNADNLLGADNHDSSKHLSDPRYLYILIPKPDLEILSWGSGHDDLLKPVLGARSLRSVTKVRDVSIWTKQALKNQF